MNDGSAEKPYFMSKGLMKILGKKNKFEDPEKSKNWKHWSHPQYLDTITLDNTQPLSFCYFLRIFPKSYFIKLQNYKAVVLLLLIYCLLLLPLCLVLNVLLCSTSCPFYFCNHLKPVTLFCLSAVSQAVHKYSLLCLFLTVPWVGHQCMIVVFPGHAYFSKKWLNTIWDYHFDQLTLSYKTYFVD